MYRTLNLAATCLSIIIMASVSTPARTSKEYGFRVGLNMTTQSTESTGFVSTFRSVERGWSFFDDYAAHTRTGFQIGGFITFDLNAQFSIQPEFLYTEKGVKVEGVGTMRNGDLYFVYNFHEKIKLTYLEIPVLVKFRFPTQGKLRPSLFAGPALALNLSGSEQIDLQAAMSGGPDELTLHGNPDITNLKGSDIGLVVGGDIKILTGSANFILDVRYTIGTSEVFEDVDPDSIPIIDFDELFPSKFPVAHFQTGEASDAKNRAFSITLGVSFPM